MTTAPPTTPKPRRCWLQFSLRTLMVLVLVVGAGLGWLAHENHRARTQREAVKAIEKLGGRAEYEARSGGCLAAAIAFGGKLLPHDWLVDVYGVSLADMQLADAELAHLQGLQQLKWLALNNTSITDAGLAHLRGLTELEQLTLAFTRVTDAGLIHLQRLTHLEMLSLVGTRVTDAGLEQLSGLTHLQMLDLAQTQVTDAGLMHVRTLTNLRYLSLDSARVTDAGVAELRKALPNCQITR
jgi:hypothetical protein